MKKKILDEVELIVSDRKKKIANIVSDYYFYYMGIPATSHQIEKLVHHVQEYVAKRNNVQNKEIEVSELRKMIDNLSAKKAYLSSKMQ